ncbi:MAG: carbohydrate ABC transporter permease [Epulopiscium sp.]|nr:carbohydrate ABC transporter permease [Candidatus Epulonipiscium sp.]
MQENIVEYNRDSKILRWLFRTKHWISSPSRIKNVFVRIMVYILLLNLTFVFVYPFMYMVVTALKSNADLNDFTVNWVPRSLKFENFAIAYHLLNYRSYLENSILITFLATLGHLISCSFIGYGFARYSFPFKNLLFLLVIVSFIVPVQTIIVPLYITYKNLGWLDTYLPLIIPTFFGFGMKGALFIFLFRQFYMGLPKELEEAAKIDGCGFFMTYVRIVMPIAKASFLVALVLSLVWHWNDFYEPAIYISKVTKAVLPSRINHLVSIVNAPPEELFDLLELVEGEDTLNNAVMMAGTFLIILPVLIVFAFAQKQFMQGIETTGMKE